MNRLAILLLCVCISAIGVYADDEESSYLKLAGAADEAIAEENWADAEQYMLEAMRLEPTNPSNVMLLSNLAIVRFQMGEDSLALATINDAHEMAPVSVTVLNNRAYIQSVMGHLKEAYDDYTRILELDSTLVEPRIRHTLIALKNGNFAVAEQDFVVLNRLAPTDDGTYIAGALLYSSTNRPAEAISYYTKLLQKDPAAEYYSGRAECYIRTQQYNEASADIADGMKMYPNDSEFYLLRAWLNKLRYRYDDAKADGERAIQMGADPERVSRVL